MYDRLTGLRGGLKHFNYLKLSLYCDSQITAAGFKALLEETRQPSKRLGLHIAIEDLAVALYSVDWFIHGPCFDAEEIRSLIWDPQIVLFVFSGMTRQPTWAWSYWNGCKVTDAIIASTCKQLGLDRNRILKSYDSDLMRFGSEWEMQMQPIRS